MSWRVVNMTLGLSSEVAGTSNQTSDVEALSFRGATNVGRGQYPAQITKASGFDAPMFDIQGGGRYSGGSIFVGSRANDRELTLTTVAHGAYSPSDVKTRLHKLMSVSSMDPLYLDIKLVDDYGGEMVFMAPVYISQIASPIFDKSPEVQVVMKMGDVAFRGETYQSTSSIDTIAAPEQDVYAMKRLAPAIDFHLQRVDFSPKSTSSSLDFEANFNAPFNYDVETQVRIAKSNFDNWLGIQFVNPRGEAFRLNTRSDTLTELESMLDPDDDVLSFSVGLNSKTRRIRIVTVKDGLEVSQDRDIPFNVTTHGGFPMGIPGLRPLSVDTIYTRLVSHNDFLGTEQRVNFESARYGF